MFFKGVIFDLDDTLYDYKVCEKKAYKEVEEYLKNKYNFNLHPKLEELKKIIKNELNCTSASHNRFIYFKKLLENTNIPLFEIIEINDIYWNEFYKNIKPRECLEKFIKNLKSWGKKIIILTDFQTEYQFKKLKKIGILDLIDYIVTSEEVGIEKPSFKMFDQVLRMTNLKKEELITFGDDLIKDVIASKDYGIHSFHMKFDTFNEFNEFFTDLHKDIEDFVKMCNIFGERFDLVQLGGGNISVKNNNLMIIKASGFNMKNIDNCKGYSLILNDKLLKDISKDNNLNNYTIFKNDKPSIETYMHSILKKYTVHLHPIKINKILVRKNSREELKKIYPDALVLDYIPPGLKVAEKILSEDYQNKKRIFLLNHGIILTSDSLEEIYQMVEEFEMKEFEIDKNYSLCENIYLNSKIDIIKKYYDKYCFPDAVIYLKNNYYIENDKIYLKSKNLEEILKANIMILEGEGEIEFLEEEQINELCSREDEKYRKNIKN